MLTESGEPMTTKAMIEAMAAKGYWTSPGGATPWATLYSALIREIAPDTGTFSNIYVAIRPSPGTRTRPASAPHRAPFPALSTRSSTHPGGR